MATRLQQLKLNSNFYLIFVLFGGLMLFGSLWFRYSKLILSFNKTPQTVTEEDVGSNPVSIALVKQNMTLDVTEGVIKDGVWEISETGASHLNISADPGEGGNVVVYGHNKKNLFGPLLWVSVGDKVEVTDSENKKYTYIISQVVETDPDNIDFVLPKQEETLTLYTCSGFLYSARHVVVAKPEF